MAQNPLAPPPPGGQPEQDKWLYLLWRRLTQSGQILWSSLDTTGSNLTDIETRNHNDLQSMQGGTPGEYYHLTAAQSSELARTGVQAVAVDTALSDTFHTTYVTATGKTVTLPAASAARVGKTWTVIQDTTGTMTVVAVGANTFRMDGSGSVQSTIKGTALTFECLTATSWGLV